MSIDEILTNYYRKTIRVDGNTPNARQEAKQALYKDMLELLGENEELKSKYIKKDDEIFMANRLVFRNQLRQELRTKLRKYYGVEE